MKFKVSELFYSAQGEGRYVGVPSIFLRMFGCNFTCSGFGCRPGTISTEADEVAKNVHLYKTFEELPLVNTGCDSYASWHPEFKHLSPTYTAEELVEKMASLLPNGNWQQPNGNPVHLVITGGEPLLGWQRAYPELLDLLHERGLRHITFETNGTQELHRDFAQYLDGWFGEITFSVSPKLSVSGEKWEDAIKPDIVWDYETHGITYLKFVVGHIDDFTELDRAVDEYRLRGFAGPVFVMPVGGVVSVYDGNRIHVADEALKRGYWYSPRLHVDLWGNGWGKWFKKKKKVTKRELPEVSKTPPIPEIKAPVKSEKQIATEAGEPWVQVLSIEVDPNNLHQGAFELDWNEIFVARLVKAGYMMKKDDTDAEIVDRWFQNVCRHVVMETWEQEEAIKKSGIYVQSRDIGNGRSEVS